MPRNSRGRHALVRGSEVSMRKLRFSERQIAFIRTKAAAACPRGGTTCCPLVPKAPSLRTSAAPCHRSSPSKIEMMCRFVLGEHQGISSGHEAVGSSATGGVSVISSARTSGGDGRGWGQGGGYRQSLKQCPRRSQVGRSEA